MNLIDNPSCSCNTGIEDKFHFLYNCPFLTHQEKDVYDFNEDDHQPKLANHPESQHSVREIIYLLPCSQNGNVRAIKTISKTNLRLESVGA